MDRNRLHRPHARETGRAVAANPRSAAAHAGSRHLFGRAPTTWMNKNAGTFPELAG